MNPYANAFGVWRVTTEGDCEGRSVRDLGVHEGYLDEIAFALADKVYYSLQFSTSKKITMEPKTSQVSVSLNIDSGTWDMVPTQRVNFFRSMLEGRDVFVSEGQYYASVVLSTNKFDKKSELINNALKKLTKEEIEALGLK